MNIPKSKIDSTVKVITDYIYDKIVDLAVNVADDSGIAPEPDSAYDEIYDSVHEQVITALLNKLK